MVQEAKNSKRDLEVVIDQLERGQISSAARGLKIVSADVNSIAENAYANWHAQLKRAGEKK